MDPEARKMMRDAGRLGAIGIELAGTVIGCLLLGYWLDGRFHTAPWLAVGGIVFGSFAGFWVVYKTVKLSSEPPPPPPPPPEA
jgi:F0F1-type ATP synthase assembly protein I